MENTSNYFCNFIMITYIYKQMFILYLMVKKGFSSEKDTGWGVIYRLNDLFREVEILAPSGKYDEWNFKLDRIWSNLLYRENMKIEYDEDKKNVISIEIDEDAYKIKMFFDKEISRYKKEVKLERKKNNNSDENKVSKEYIIAKNNLYKSILKKEIWLRKYMRELDLYLKEIEHNPAGAMFGS